MKKLLLVTLFCMGIAYNAHAILFKDWKTKIDAALTEKDLELIGSSGVTGATRAAVTDYYEKALAIAKKTTPPPPTPPAPAPPVIDKIAITKQVDEVANLLKSVQTQLKAFDPTLNLSKQITTAAA